MKYKSMNKVVIATALLVCFSSKAVMQISTPVNQPDANQELQANKLANQPASQANSTHAEQVMGLLRACLTDFEDKASFGEFIDKMLKILENPDARQQIKNELPGLNVDALIVALKKVRSRTNSILIGWDLKPFFKNLPQDLQDTSKLLAGLSKRLAIKK